MEAFGGTGYFSAGLPAPETRKGKLVSDRCHGEGADKGRVMSSLHVSRVASRWTVACAVSWPGAVGSRLQQPTVGSEQNTHRTRVQVRCRAQGTGQGGLGEWIACVDVRAERQRGERLAGFASFTTNIPRWGLVGGCWSRTSRNLVVPSHGDGDGGGRVLGTVSRQSSRGEANGGGRARSAERAALHRKWAGATLPRWSFVASNDRWAAVN